MKDAILERLRGEVVKLKATIERYKDGSWKTGIVENGKLIDTSDEDLQWREELLQCLEGLIAEWDSQGNQR